MTNFESRRQALIKKLKEDLVQIKVLDGVDSDLNFIPVTRVIIEINKEACHSLSTVLLHDDIAKLVVDAASSALTEAINKT